MKYASFLGAFALLTATSSLLSSCQHESEAPAPATPTIPDTPHTAIPNELVGTWLADGNTGSLITNWDQGTVQGNQSQAGFRTMVFTQNGKNAVEYTSEVVSSAGEVQQRLYKPTGTLEYQAGAAPATLTFHVQSGTMRVGSTKYTGYKDLPIGLADLQACASLQAWPGGFNPPHLPVRLVP